MHHGTIQASQFKLAELFKYSNRETRSSTAFFLHLTFKQL